MVTSSDSSPTAPNSSPPVGWLHLIGMPFEVHPSKKVSFGKCSHQGVAHWHQYTLHGVGIRHRHRFIPLHLKWFPSAPRHWHVCQEGCYMMNHLICHHPITWYHVCCTAVPPSGGRQPITEQGMLLQKRSPATVWVSGALRYLYTYITYAAVPPGRYRGSGATGINYIIH